MVTVCDPGIPRGSFARPLPGGGEARWWPFSGGTPRKTLASAMAIVQKNIRNSSSCNNYFSRLSGTRSFKDVWDDAGVWIHWDPRGDPGFYGVTTHEFPVADVTISNFALNKGVWVTVATLVHELAHVNGAPGGTSTAAEDALPQCGLRGLVDPGAVGWRQASDDSNERYASSDDDSDEGYT
jgi:hypothetical protein